MPVADELSEDMVLPPDIREQLQELQGKKEAQLAVYHIERGRKTQIKKLGRQDPHIQLKEGEGTKNSIEEVVSSEDEEQTSDSREFMAKQKEGVDVTGKSKFAKSKMGNCGTSQDFRFHKDRFRGDGVAQPVLNDSWSGESKGLQVNTKPSSACCQRKEKRWGRFKRSCDCTNPGYNE